MCRNKFSFSGLNWSLRALHLQKSSQADVLATGMKEITTALTIAKAHYDSLEGGTDSLTAMQFVCAQV